MLGLAKILENMEIGHNVMHGQWDWMNDPEIHSSNWEWDTAQPAEQWKHSHNYVHHQFTNVLGHDNDIGYGILRMAREQKWHPVNLGQPVYNALLATLFQWGVALHDLDIERIRKGEKDPKEMKRQLRQIVRKGRNQILKDYVVYPALVRAAVEVDAEGQRDREPGPQPVVLHDHLLRPLPRRGDALHRGGARGRDPRRSGTCGRCWAPRTSRVARCCTSCRGSLGFQIEHHLFPDLPSNRYPEIAVKVQALCEKYDLPYTTGPLHRQYGQALRTIIKLSLPNHLTSDDPARPSAPTPPTSRGPAPIRRRASPAPYRARRLVPERVVSAVLADAQPVCLVRDRIAGPHRQAGHAVRAEPDLRCVRAAARPPRRLRRYADRGRAERLPPASAAHHVRRRTPAATARTRPGNS